MTGDIERQTVVGLHGIHLAVVHLLDVVQPDFAVELGAVGLVFQEGYFSVGLAEDGLHSEYIGLNTE